MENLTGVLFRPTETIPNKTTYARDNSVKKVYNISRDKFFKAKDLPNGYALLNLLFEKDYIVKIKHGQYKFKKPLTYSIVYNLLETCLCTKYVKMYRLAVRRNYI